MKLGSLFDGSGGFPLAGTMCGFVPTFASEVEPYPIAVTKSRFPHMKHLGDISKINGANIEPVDIITFGSPCQDLSVAGKRAGLKHEDNGDDETTRSGLFMEAVRIIKEMRGATNGEYPKFCIWENVPGAFSSNKGEDFRIVLEELIKIAEPSAVMPDVPKKGWAYADSFCGDGWSLAYRVLDAQYLRTAQRRRRIYLVLDLGGQRARQILFERESLRGYSTESRETRQDTPTDVERSVGTDDREGTVCYGISSKQQSLVTTEGGGNTLGANDYKEPQAVCYGISSYDSNAMKSDNPHSGVYEANTSRTIDANGGNPACNQGGVAIVQGFDGYNGDVTGDKSSTLGVNCGMSTGRNGVITDTHILDACNQALTGDKSKTISSAATDSDHVPCAVYSVENHPNDSRVKIDDEGKVQALTSRMGTGGGNVPMVMEPFCKAHRASSADDATTWKEGEVANTLNTFDQGETRVNEIVVMATQQGGAEITENGVCPTITAAAGMSGNNQPVAVYKETVALEGNGQRPSHQGNGYAETDKSYTLNATEVHGVAYEQPIAIDRAFFNQGQNALYDPQTYEDGTNPTIVAKGPSAVCYWDGSQTAGTLTARNAGGAQRMPDKENFVAVVEQKPQYIVRRLTPTEYARLQGFPDAWGHIELKNEFADGEYEFWLEVRKTHDRINDRKEKDYTEKQMLTWYNKLWTDSAEYKMWGNGIALPCALYVMQGIEDVMKGRTNGGF